MDNQGNNEYKNYVIILQKVINKIYIWQETFWKRGKDSKFLLNFIKEELNKTNSNRIGPNKITSNGEIIDDSLNLAN